MSSIVYILESPSSDDFLSQTQEGEIISKTLSLTNIPNSHYTVVNRKCLIKVIEEICSFVTEEPHLPIIHISAHGSEEGLALTSEEELVRWKELRDTLKPLSDKCGDRLLLCFSTCFGVNGYKTAMTFTKVFEDAIGPTDAIGWSETIVAYSCFYHLFLEKEFSVKDAVFRMNAAIGSDEARFMAVSGSAIRKAYTRGFINTVLRKFL